MTAKDVGSVSACLLSVRTPSSFVSGCQAEQAIRTSAAGHPTSSSPPSTYLPAAVS